MKRAMKRVGSILMAVVMVMALFTALPMSALAAPVVSGATVTIKNADTVDSIMEVIDDLLNGLNNSGQNPGYTQYNTVTVQGSKSNANKELMLNIPSGKKVVWKAAYSEAASSFQGCLISINSAGTFEVAAGGSITASTNNLTALRISSISSPTITITGGSVTSRGTGDAYAIFTMEDGVSVVVSGGMVKADNNNAICILSGGTVEVSGGMVTTGNGIYDAIRTTTGNITVKGGSVTNTGTTVLEGSAIYTDSGRVTVTGGTVDGNNVAAIFVANGVAAYLAGTCKGAFNAISGGMIVEVDTLSVPASRDGGSVGLTRKAGGGTAVWNTRGANPVISFSGIGATGTGKVSIIWSTTGPGLNQSWTPPSSTNRFNDVPNNNWQNAAVSWADENGITTGSPANSSTFKPNDTITRAEFVTFLHRIYGSPSATRATFSDMPTNSAFQNAISWALENGVTTGSPAGSNTFLPNDNITREQIAAMLHRYISKCLPAPSNALGGYTDVNLISTWAGAREAVNWAVYNEIMGQNVTTLNPRGNATRAEAVTMLYRVVERFEIPAP